MLVPVHPLHRREVVADPHKQRELALCARSFRHFTRYWTFLDQESGQHKRLGDVLWLGQEQLVEAMEHQPMIYALKARKLGFTTLEIAYDAWVARFRGKNARVHLFSRRMDAAVELLDAVKYGLYHLPPWMQLPVVKDPTELLILQAGDEDRRIVKPYPADNDTAVEATCTHGHVDEWARMGNPRRVWQAIEPSMAFSCHIITTGIGPANFTAAFWRKSLAGDTRFVPIFVDALARQGRDDMWLAEKRKSMTEESFRQEFPMRWEDALFAGGAFKFRGVDVDVAGVGRGPTPPVPDHRYIKSWDIGRHQDAAVGVVIDVSQEPNQVVEYLRLRGVPYPTLQAQIERIHRHYEGATVIEKNNAGEAVAENLDLPEREVILFNTSASSKARIIEELQLALEGRGLQWSAAAWPQLDDEVRGYQVPDDNIVQDSVMALAIGNANVTAPFRHGRVGAVETW